MRNSNFYRKYKNQLFGKLWAEDVYKRQGIDGIKIAAVQGVLDGFQRLANTNIV